MIGRRKRFITLTSAKELFRPRGRRGGHQLDPEAEAPGSSPTKVQRADGGSDKFVDRHRSSSDVGFYDGVVDGNVVGAAVDRRDEHVADVARKQKQGQSFAGRPVV